MFKNHMTYIRFDKVIQHLISKFSKEKPIFWYFAFFSIRKAVSHMIFSYPELFEYSGEAQRPQTRADDD